MITKLSGIEFRNMIVNASVAIEKEKQHINDLNVFPVPDGDTGTNMTLTISAGAQALNKENPRNVGKAAEITASALLRGARGNSGVILSLLFRGMSKGLKDKAEADAMDFARAMAEGVGAAYKAVMKPAEGTILTVSRLASTAALECAADEADIELVLEHAIKVGNEALADTVNQNPVLKKAGVIDSGGKGYMTILTGMLKALRGEMIQATDQEPAQARADFSSFSTESITFMYCTEFIIGRENKKDPGNLRDFLDNMGDSLVLVDDDEIIKVHVHTDEPGKAITEALTYGSLLTVKIENMREQHTEQVIHDTITLAADKSAEKMAASEKKYGIVVVSAGDGLAEVFRDLGADGIITGGQTMNPSTNDILKAIDATPAEIVYVFPNNKNIIMTAEQTVSESEKKVVIIPSKTIAQGITALLAMDPSAQEEANTSAMKEALSKVHTAQITYASRDSDFNGEPIKAGQYLALLENALLGSDDSFSAILERTVSAVESYSPEFITVFYGEDVDESDANKCAEFLSKRFPDAEVTVVYGGQPVYCYMISLE